MPQSIAEKTEEWAVNGDSQSPAQITALVTTGTHIAAPDVEQYQKLHTGGGNRLHKIDLAGH